MESLETVDGFRLNADTKTDYRPGALGSSRRLRPDLLVVYDLDKSRAA